MEEFEDFLNKLGEHLDKYSKEYRELPNEYTKGRLEGLVDVYKDFVEGPKKEDEEDPLFMKPPKGPSKLPPKYSTSNVNTTSSTNQGNFTVWSNIDPYNDSDEILLLKNIRNILDDLRDCICGIEAENSEPESEDVAIAPSGWTSANEDEEPTAFSYVPEEEEAYAEESETTDPQPKLEWESNFGKRRSDSVEKDMRVVNEYTDIDTGEAVSETVIGKIDLGDGDGDTSQTFEEWKEKRNKQDTGHHYHVDPGDQYGLEDLGPGD